MLEKLLAVRYIKQQKRHSIFTVSSIAIAMALMTLLFVGFSTYRGIIRDAAYMDKPYHFKLMRLTEEEIAQLEARTDLISVKRVVEPNYTLSAEIMTKAYNDDFGLYINSFFPEKHIYNDRFEQFDYDQVDFNAELIAADRLDLPSRYKAVQDVAVYFIFIIFLILTLRLMIDTAFEISSKERERQFGVLQCVGATPGQIVGIISIEGLLLCVIGIPLGLLLGLGLSVGAFEAVKSSGIAETFYSAEKAAQVMHMHIEPLLLLLAAATGIVWVFLSAYGTGMRIVKMSPIQAISGRSNKIVKVRRRSLFGALFGWKGKLAARNNRRQPKRFIITVLSLTLSIALFASFSIVLKQSLATFEKMVQIIGLDYDLGLTIKTNPADQLSYQKGLSVVRESGYFDIVDFYKSQFGYVDSGDGTTEICLLNYYPRETYEAQFEGEPPLSYDELTQQGGYLLMIPQNNSEDSITSKMLGAQSVDLELLARTIISDEEYEKMTPAEKSEVQDYIQQDYNLGTSELLFHYRSEKVPASVRIVGTAPEKKIDEQAKQFLAETSGILILVSTLDTFESGAYALTGSAGSVFSGSDSTPIHVNLKDENDYQKAMTFLGMNNGVLTLEEDYYGDLQKTRAIVGAIKIGVAFLSILIGLIALVNMVNILSTGILNRKSELAAMQCLGMTQGQLNGMTVIECLQYALTAGVLATVLLEGLMYVMLLLLKKVELDEVFGEMLNFAEPLPRIWIAAVVAFAVAVLASFIPLHRMQQESLTDQIRSVE